MNKTYEEKINLLDIDNLMFCLFIIASLLNLDANEKMKESYLYNNVSKEKIRKQFIFSSYLILIVFIVFMKRNYDNLNKLNNKKSEYNFALIRLYGSILIVIGQILVIYYLYNTNNFQD